MFIFCSHFVNRFSILHPKVIGFSLDASKENLAFRSFSQTAAKVRFCRAGKTEELHMSHTGALSVILCSGLNK